MILRPYDGAFVKDQTVPTTFV